MANHEAREAYRRECIAIASSDKRWAKGSQASMDDCSVCNGSTTWRFRGKHKCPWCHRWLQDSEADSIPMLPEPVFLRPLTETSHLKCENCQDKGLPAYEWHWAGVKRKKLALGAHCQACQCWIKWVSIPSYGPYAPPKPPVKMAPDEEYLFDDLEADATKQQGNFFESVGEGDSTKKKGKEPVPPPPKKGKALSPLERCVLCVRLYEHGERLYLNEKGEVCCTNWEAMPDPVTYGLKQCAARLKKAIIEDIYFQLRACETSPHVLHLHPQDKGRRIVFEAWKKGDRTNIDDHAPGLTIDEICEAEKESLGVSLTRRRLEKNIDYGRDHAEAVPISIEVASETTGGLF